MQMAGSVRPAVLADLRSRSAKAMNELVSAKRKLDSCVKDLEAATRSIGKVKDEDDINDIENEIMMAEDIAEAVADIPEY